MTDDDKPAKYTPKRKLPKVEGPRKLTPRRDYAVPTYAASDIKHFLTALFAEMAEGKPMAQIIRDNPGFPSTRWFLRFFNKNPEIQKVYEEAKYHRAAALVDKMFEVVEAPLPPNMEPHYLSAHINQRRMQVDIIKFTASKLDRKNFGEKVVVEHEAGLNLQTIMAEANNRVIEGQAIDITPTKPKQGRPKAPAADEIFRDEPMNFNFDEEKD